MEIVSAALVLFLVMDPFGNIPPFMVALKDVEPGRRTRVILRELVIALAVLVAFLFGGRYVLALLRIEQPSLNIAGGIILFLIAVRMIFQPPERVLSPGGPGGQGACREPAEEPFIVPLAVPYVAGPSAAATILLLTTREPGRVLEWLAALAGAWLVTGVILLLSAPLSRLLGDKVLGALARLMGMILTVIAVQMVVTGVRDIFAT